MSTFKRKRNHWEYKNPPLPHVRRGFLGMGAFPPRGRACEPGQGWGLCREGGGVWAVFHLLRHGGDLLTSGPHVLLYEGDTARARPSDETAPRSLNSPDARGGRAECPSTRRAGEVLPRPPRERERAWGEFLNSLSLHPSKWPRESAPIRVLLKGASNRQAGILIHCIVFVVHRLDPQTPRE